MQKYYQRKTFRDEGHAWVNIWLDHSVWQDGKVDVSVKMKTGDQNKYMYSTDRSKTYRALTKKL